RAGRVRQAGEHRENTRARHIAADADGRSASASLVSIRDVVYAHSLRCVPPVGSAALFFTLLAPPPWWVVHRAWDSVIGLWKDPPWLPRAPIAPLTSHFAPLRPASPSRSSATPSRSRIC